MTTRWAYGVTTVPSRRHDLLPRTLAALRDGGFSQPRLFVDGSKDATQYELQTGLETTVRGKIPLRTYGNWVLGLWELLVRNPDAERFAMFQDDFVCVRNLRQYLERLPFQPKSYLNLYTFRGNQELCGPEPGFYRSNQMGRGAVALVFDIAGVLALLSAKHTVERPQDKERGHRSIDGGIATAMASAGYAEYVHGPSLVQHEGAVSSMGNPPHARATSFPGSDFDAMSWISAP